MDKTMSGPPVNFADLLVTLDDQSARAAAAQQINGFLQQAAITHVTLEELKRRGVKLSPALAQFNVLLTLCLNPGNAFGVTVSDDALDFRKHLEEVLEISGKAARPSPPARKQPEQTPPENVADVQPDTAGNVVSIFSRKTLH